MKIVQLALELFTTDEYTGIVGVGRLDESKYGHFDNFYQLVTDFGGKVTAPYISGNAAKTVIMRARDTVTGCVGLGYITSYVEGEINITLDAPIRALGGQPSLTAWAENEWLTADGGHSSTKLHAIVLGQDGQPLQGRHVTFSDGFDDGRIEEIQPETNSSGEALARYYSGRKIGTAHITVTVAIANAGADGAAPSNKALSKDIFIELKSDAPAKLTITGPDDGKPLSLAANGSNHIDLTIRVTDINDNLNRGTPLEVEISRDSEGDGRLGSGPGKGSVTDFNGEYRFTFYAGTKPGNVKIKARALSSIPTPQLLDKIRIAEKGMDW